MISPIQLVGFGTVPPLLQEIVAICILVLYKLQPDIIVLISGMRPSIFGIPFPCRSRAGGISQGQKGSVIGFTLDACKFDTYRGFRAHVGPGGDRHGHYQHKTQQKCKHLTFHPNTPLPFNPLIKTLY